MRKTILCFALMTGVIAAAAAAPAAEAETNGDARVVATTSWTAAFAYAAGVEDVRVLAPMELRHPPEYELRPSDIAAVSNAQVVLFAGYERMVEKLRDAVGGQDGPSLLQITTDYSMDTVSASVTKIADAMGTSAAAKRSIEAIERSYAEWRSEIAELGLLGTPVVVHMFQKPLLEELGAEIVGVFGPAPLEARQIAELSTAGAKLIVDNFHNDVGVPLRETMKDVPVAVFINFPGAEDTRTLMDVLEYNRSELAGVVRSAVLQLEEKAD